ncbi:MAG TPA: hypothetical protein VL424_13300, partial [Pararobbsia sp.]|nr:hypothetical protein [Pararobbsia sp.]
ELLLSPAFLRAWDEPCESLVERMNAGSFRDLIVDHYLRCAEPGISNPRSNPLVLMLCAVPRLFPSGVERRRWIGLRGADLGDGRGEFGFGFLDGAPLLDCLKRDEILAKWLEHGSFPESGRTDGEPEWVDLVNYRYSRIEGGANSLIRTGRDYSHVLRVGGSESFDFETREPWTDIRASGTEISVSEQELEEEMQKTGMGAKECVLGMLRTRGFVGIDADSCIELPRECNRYEIRLSEIPQA